MGVWDSVRNAVDRVTGSAAHVSVAVDRGVVRPGDDLKVHVVVKNGPAPLEATTMRFLLLRKSTVCKLSTRARSF